MFHRKQSYKSRGALIPSVADYLLVNFLFRTKDASLLLDAGKSCVQR
ncbi:hypothetical protein HMPREF3038_01483 [Akkermansia sp. KLE1797]|nr:hypothetical protein HMPREF3038_01483 [Akkermansia sp. KLE1797]KXU55418.1 hypothetical protein HMPREF3039_00391 [Akkermansia sp. KLE1798]KZA03415.1 hypothetical protein HMPREF1326_02844 [Akkermansia sp. KLE1605]